MTYYISVAILKKSYRNDYMKSISALFDMNMILVVDSSYFDYSELEESLIIRKFDGSLIIKDFIKTKKHYFDFEKYIGPIEEWIELEHYHEEGINLSPVDEFSVQLLDVNINFETKEDGYLRGNLFLAPKNRFTRDILIIICREYIDFVVPSEIDLKSFVKNEEYYSRNIHTMNLPSLLKKKGLSVRLM